MKTCKSAARLQPRNEGAQESPKAFSASGKLAGLFLKRFGAGGSKAFAGPIKSFCPFSVSRGLQRISLVHGAEPCTAKESAPAENPLEGEPRAHAPEGYTTFI
jgi:hypothetical protein